MPFVLCDDEYHDLVYHDHDREREVTLDDRELVRACHHLLCHDHEREVAPDNHQHHHEREMQAAPDNETIYIPMTSRI